MNWVAPNGQIIQGGVSELKNSFLIMLKSSCKVYVCYKASLHLHQVTLPPLSHCPRLCLPMSIAREVCAGGDGAMTTPVNDAQRPPSASSTPESTPQCDDNNSKRHCEFSKKLQATKTNLKSFNLLTLTKMSIRGLFQLIKKIDKSLDTFPHNFSTSKTLNQHHSQHITHIRIFSHQDEYQRCLLPCNNNYGY